MKRGMLNYMEKRVNFILLNGAIGSGKSTIVDILKTKLKRTAILEIEDIRQLISDYKQGKKEDNSLSWKIIYRMCDEYFKNGVSVLLKQTVCSQEIVNKFLRLATKSKCNIYFYHLQAPRSELLKRISKRKKARKVSKALVITNIKKHEQIHYANATIIDTTKMKSSEVAIFILNDLKK